MELPLASGQEALKEMVVFRDEALRNPCTPTSAPTRVRASGLLAVTRPGKP